MISLFQFYCVVFLLFIFLETFYRPQYTGGCITDTDCPYLMLVCEEIVCVEPTCVFKLLDEAECSITFKCEEGFYCTSDCKCEKMYEKIEDKTIGTPVTQERKEYCDNLIGDYLKSYVYRRKPRSLESEMVIYEILTLFKNRCETGEGECESVYDFIHGKAFDPLYFPEKEKEVGLKHK